MPSRRSVLTFLGLAPIAAPAVIAAAATPESVTVGADVTEAGVTIGHVVTPSMIRAELISQYALLPRPDDLAQLTRTIRRASAGTTRASRTPAHGGRFLPKTTGRGLRAPAPLGDDERAAA